ncbi:SAC3/GANP/Nin1/mts3/eIF-3 p25 family-domain-containing protein [Pelagophyceae sp. CCMP2097]|nr:SAC3/GANP/Nin1/mts3/eIF-3 p25 family-domain-containing protein [Pelagophyceae sp. CCMP2097]
MDVDGGDGEALFAEFSRGVEAGQYAAAEASLLKLKLLLLTPGADRGLGLRTLELAVLMAVKANDERAFDRHFQQLKPYYADKKLRAASTQYGTVLGLYLLFLIVEARLAEFHSELELMTPVDRGCAEIAFAVKLEQDLMVGTYNQVLGAKKNMPSQLFEFFMARLLDTVRGTIADCAEVSYESISLEAARDLMMFDDAAALADFVKRDHSSWQVVGGRIHFNLAKQKKSSGIPSLRLITENLAYATELERIV